MSNLKISADLALPLDVAGEAIGILATRGAGKSYTSAVLIAELHNAGIQVVVIDPAGVYWGLRSSAKGTGDGLPIIVLGGVHGDVPLESTAGKVIADLVVDTGQSLILDLSDFESDTAQARFMAEFSDRLYRRKARSRTTLHLIVDEADEFAPQKPQKGEEKMLHSMVRLVKRGRSRGIGLTLITQRSASISKAALDLVESLIVMRMLSPRDRDAIAGWVQNKRISDDLGVLESLPSLPTGTAWVWSPLRAILKKVPIRRIETFDSYATPKPGETRVEPKALAEVDLEKLGAQIKATVERAKQDDPKALRAQIAELKRDAAKPRELTVDVQALEDAEKRGYARGHADGYLAALQNVLDDLATRGEVWRQGVSRAVSFSPATIEDRKRDTPAPAVRAPSQRPAPRAPSVPIEGVSRSQQKILEALAALESIGIEQPSRTQLALWAEVSPTSGGYFNNLGALRTAGLIDYPSGGTVTLTEAGRDRAPTPAPMSVAEMQDSLCAKVGNSKAAILRALIGIYPRDIARDALAEKIGVSSTSGGYFNNLGSLRTLGVIDYPQPGRVVALPVLFLE